MIVGKTQGEPEASEMAQKPVVCPIEQIPAYNVSCRDWGRMCRVWLGLVGMKSELGDSLTKALLALSVKLIHLALP